MDQIQDTLNSGNQYFFYVSYFSILLWYQYVLNHSSGILFLYCNKGSIVILYASVSEYFLFDCKRFLFQRFFFISVSVLYDVNDMHITFSLSSLPYITLSLKTWSEVIQGLVCWCILHGVICDWHLSLIFPSICHLLQTFILYTLMGITLTPTTV